MTAARDFWRRGWLAIALALGLLLGLAVEPASGATGLAGHDPAVASAMQDADAEHPSCPCCPGVHCVSHCAGHAAPPRDEPIRFGVMPPPSTAYGWVTDDLAADFPSHPPLRPPMA